MTMRIRKEAQANYSAVFVDGKTIRIPINPKLPITELHFPEFYDLSPGNKCSGACSYCYAGALKNGVHYKNLVSKVDNFFGKMTLNQRPFQVAIGGEQEPLENPEIWDMMARLRELEIVPNYTTNGMFVNDKNIELTKKYSGGVAVTLHTHLEKFWRRALARFAEAKVKLNVHVIISGKESIDATERLYKEYVDSGQVDYFVLLPYMNYGHAVNEPKSIDYDHFAKWLDTVYADGKIAFGANFYNFIRKNAAKFNVSLYPPEIMSKYIILDDKMQVSNNSFEKKSVNFNHSTGCELGMARTEFLAA
jgi:sulfatase maturation enzyme AslB (radical SAM superfamily)